MCCLILQHSWHLLCAILCRSTVPSQSTLLIILMHKTTKCNMPVQCNINATCIPVRANKQLQENATAKYLYTHNKMNCLVLKPSLEHQQQQTQRTEPRSRIHYSTYMYNIDQCTLQPVQAVPVPVPGTTCTLCSSLRGIPGQAPYRYRYSTGTGTYSAVQCMTPS